jgi:enoyl-CoA hydratase/carnithine racemase
MNVAVSSVAVSDHDGVRTVRLARPERLNALNTAIFEAVREALEDAASGREIACLVLTGTGRAFTSGMDLVDDGESPERRATAWLGFVEAIESFPKPLVVGVNGLAVGFGTTVLGHADIAVAAESARFRAPFASLGLVPEAGATARLPAVMGAQAAAHLCFTGSWLSAREAQAAGLVWRVVADDALDTELADLGAQIAAGAVDSLIATKRLLLDARLPEARAARLREQARFDELLAGPAFAEAVRAFEEKRRPDFPRTN